MDMQQRKQQKLTKLSVAELHSVNSIRAE